MVRSIVHKHEFALLLFIVALSCVIGSVNPAFFSLSNFYDLLKSSVVTGILAQGVLLVLVSGGIDISFTAIAAASMYFATLLALAFQPSASIGVVLLLSGAIGTALGWINAVFIAVFRLPTLIVTLGTASLFRGFMLGFVGTSIVNQLPESMVRFSKLTVGGTGPSNAETGGLAASCLLFLFVSLCIALLLRYTLWGRGIYAMGGNSDAATRAGFHCKRIQFALYGLVGFLAGVAGLIHACHMRNANPFDLVGMELDVIAAAVLGGAGILGGQGTVLGTTLGVFLLVILKNSLILLDIPTYWQKVAVGAILISSTWLSTSRRQSNFRGMA